MKLIDGLEQKEKMNLIYRLKLLLQILLFL